MPRLGHDIVHVSLFERVLAALIVAGGSGVDVRFRAEYTRILFLMRSWSQTAKHV